MDQESQEDFKTLEVRTLFGDKVNVSCSSQTVWSDVKKQVLTELKYTTSENPSDQFISNYSFLNGIEKLNEDSTSCFDFLENSKTLTIINTSSIFTKPHIWIGLQCMSSITLTLVNKHLSSSFDAPLMIIIIQTIIGVIAFLICKQFNILPFNFPTLRELGFLLPTSLFFVLLTWTSFEGLKTASVPLVTVTRNLVPLLTAIIDRVFFDYKMNFTIQLSLVAVFVGSIFYSFSDYTLQWNGYHWVVMNTLCSVLIPLVEKRILNSWMPSVSPISMNFARNLLSLPIFYFILYISTDRVLVGYALASMSTLDWIYTGITSIFGFLIGLSYFFLLKLVTNTSISIANSCYKLVTLVLSFAFFGVTFSLFGWFGIFMSFVGVFIFSYESSKKK